MRSPPSSSLGGVVTTPQSSSSKTGNTSPAHQPGGATHKGAGDEDARPVLLKRQISEMEKQEEEYLMDAWKVLETVLNIPLKNLKMEIQSGLKKLQEALDAGRSSRATWKKAREELQNLEQIAAKEACDKNSQTHPKRGRKEIGSPEDINKALPATKKKKPEDPSAAWTTVNNKKSRDLGAQANKAQVSGEREAPLNKKGPKNKERERPPKMRREAVLIKPAKGKTYVEILSEIRKNVNPDDTQTDVKSIRQTRAGDVLLELGSTTKNRESFRMTLQNSLGEAGKVKDLIPRATLEIRDLDSVTNKEDVEEALKNELHDASGDLTISITKPNSRGLKLAIVEMDEQAASNLLEKGGIKIGWVKCRVRQRVLVTRCFRCLGYGHIARNCTGPDRISLCYRCGENGHKAAICKSTPRCMLCMDLKGEVEDLTHIPGSGGCMVFREALAEAKEKIRQ